ncbi:MAG: formate dehydrogenase accessory sulfurtransferase FdhD, partial [Myxococcota bacterium]
MSQEQTSAVKRVRLYRAHRHRVELEEAEDCVVREEPLELRLRDTSIAVLMRTPGHDEELACGFAVTEGIVAEPRDVRFAAHCRRALPRYGRNV